jgi:hypothetical protein
MYLLHPSLEAMMIGYGNPKNALNLRHTHMFFVFCCFPYMRYSYWDFINGYFLVYHSVRYLAYAVSLPVLINEHTVFYFHTTIVDNVYPCYRFASSALGVLGDTSAEFAFPNS